MKKIKAWLCAHGIHWYTFRDICCGHTRDIVCTWCGHIKQDNFDDFGGSGGFRQA